MATKSAKRHGMHDWSTLVVCAIVIALIILFVWLLGVDVRNMHLINDLPVESRLPPAIPPPCNEGPSSNEVAGVIA